MSRRAGEVRSDLSDIFLIALLDLIAKQLLERSFFETFGVLWDTTMQQQIPERMLSRLYAYDALGSICLVPVGLAVIGPVADAIGTETTLYAAALLVIGATLPVFAVRDVRELRRK